MKFDIFFAWLEAHSELTRIDPVKTGEQLRKLRQKNNLTQEELSALFDWCRHPASRVSISMWENGKKLPSLLHIVFLSALYHCSLDELVYSQRRSRSHERESDGLDRPSLLWAFLR